MLSKPKAGGVSREAVGWADIHTEQVANRVVILGAIQPTRADSVPLRAWMARSWRANSDSSQRVTARDRFGGRTRQAGRRHLAELQLLDDLRPGFAVFVEGFRRLERNQVDVARFVTEDCGSRRSCFESARKRREGPHGGPGTPKETRLASIRPST